MATTTKIFYRGTALFGPTTSRAYISNKSLTSNLATITTNAAHGITQVGTLVTIQGVDATLDGTYTVHSVPSSTTFTFVKTTANIASAAVSPVGIATFNTAVNSGFTISNKVVQNSIATLTTSSAHGLAVGDLVAVTIGDTVYDTLQSLVIAVPSTTTFSYIVSTQTAATTAVSQGSYCKIPALYTVPSATTTIFSDIIVTNMASSGQSFTIVVDGIPVAFSTVVAGNDSIDISIKQPLAASKIITGSASSPLVNFHIGGVEIS